MERKQAKTGGVGYGQFNRTANKGNKNNNDTEKGGYTTQTAQPRDQLPPLCAPEQRVSSPRPAPPQPEPSMTAHGMEYPALFGQVGSAPTPQLCPFLEPGEN